MKKVSQNQLDRIDLNKTIYESTIGRSLVEAASNLLADQAIFFEGTRFEIISARRISTSFKVHIGGHEGELWEAWEFEIFVHPYYLVTIVMPSPPAMSHSRLARSQPPFRLWMLNHKVSAPGIRSGRWIGEDTPVVACCDRLACGLQKYMRSVDRYSLESFSGVFQIKRYRQPVVALNLSETRLS